MTPAVALAVTLLTVVVGWRFQALTGGGAVAAAVIGFAVLTTTGWAGAAVLGAFFVPSSIVGRIGARKSPQLDAKGERRDVAQVLANGAAGAVGATGELVAPGLGLWLLTGALAGAASDTWATAMGALSRRAPRDIRTGARVPLGTSGGVTFAGTLGGVIGSGVVAGAGALAGRDPRLFVAGTLIGVGAMLLDSLLGAVLQGRFECPACGVASERNTHRCGARTRHVGGLRWLDNDAVNALATLTAAGAAALWYAKLH